ncbi:hypothetical protein ETB97_008553 [Aspergillus alliaceus]|uniref:Uncharacterized protein n=1 Tax=Petromyces alliaceus TaxID=209559 RepID=A0A8H5ZV23_PETAA|nr:hypothetical protein ETB97_008553 [Aspergillus burnettii]
MISAVTTAPKRFPIPEQMRIHVSVEIANLQGSVSNDPGESGFEPNEDALHTPTAVQRGKQQPNYIVSMNGERTAQGVCVVFRDGDVKLSNPDSKHDAILFTLQSAIARDTANEQDGMTLAGALRNGTVGMKKNTSRVTAVDFTLVPKQSTSWWSSATDLKRIYTLNPSLIYHATLSPSLTPAINTPLNGKDPSHPNRIGVKFENTNAWILGVPGKIPPWWRPSSPEELLDYYDKLMMTVDIDVPMADLDYFLTSNLLFSGQHIFIADSPKPDSNYDHGLAVPRGLILTG